MEWRVLTPLTIFIILAIAVSGVSNKAQEIEGGEFFPEAIGIGSEAVTLKMEIISFTEELNGVPTGRKFSFTVEQLEAMREAVLILAVEHLNQQEKAKASGFTIPMRMIEDLETKEARMETTKEYETRRRDILLRWYAQIEREHEIVRILDKSLIEGDWEKDE